MINPNLGKQRFRIEALYPGHDPEWYAEAAANLRAYLTVIIRIAERLHEEGKSINDPEE